MERLLVTLRRYLSPVFFVLLVASFVLWYIAKLSYTYTTEQLVHINMDGRAFEVPCVIEGVGTTLFGYRVYMSKTLRIPLSEVKFKRSYEDGHEGKIVLDPESLQHAIAVRYSDIKIISLGAVPEIEKPDKPAKL